MCAAHDALLAFGLNSEILPQPRVAILVRLADPATVLRVCSVLACDLLAPCILVEAVLGVVLESAAPKHLPLVTRLCRSCQLLRGLRGLQNETLRLRLQQARLSHLYDCVDRVVVTATITHDLPLDNICHGHVREDVVNAAPRFARKGLDHVIPQCLHRQRSSVSVEITHEDKHVAYLRVLGHNLHQVEGCGLAPTLPTGVD
mmetsp:Transcript_113017/g.292226  ORF Transcript_113017/g.292226 Transcript_113017/m.292226 type:complete len:202 (+) Transcript_113017:169-774(+)